MSSIPVVEKPKKRTTQNSRRIRRRVHRGSSSDDEISESQYRGPPAPLPAFVNLDSDDEYADAPNSITRNLASDQAALMSSENDEVKVVVKFGAKLEDYMLRPVSHPLVAFDVNVILMANRFPFFVAVPKIIGVDCKGGCT